MPIVITQVVDSLDWPEDDNGVPALTVECAGLGFVDYETTLVAEANGTFLEDYEEDDDDDNGMNKEDDLDEDDDTVPAIDLFELSEEELAALNYYQVLHMPFKSTLTAEDVKKYYRKACLKYHPDKSGRDEEDAVFLKVKAAFETLSTQKQAYDSTEMPFDDSLPDPDMVTNFYKEYGLVFERNLYFDARLLDNQKSNRNQRRNNRRKSKNANNQQSGPPSLGDETTSIEEVHRFYDYWTHFSTWRDFTIQAAQELETQDQLENAESRYEKRWYQKEIDKRAKKLRQLEQSRITTLVETAMNLDPRLIAEKKRLIEEKQQKQIQRERDIAERKRQQEQAKREEEQRIIEEKERKAQEKVQREKEKKQLRKIKQVFRKHVQDALTKMNQPEHSMDDKVELICTELDRDMLLALNQQLSKEQPTSALSRVTARADEIKNNKQLDAETAKQAATKAAESTATSTTTKTSRKIPFTKEELSTLAKAVKKYPPGGANRWDQIAQYLNNVCRPQNPRTKEECIETYNQVATKPGRNGGATTASTNTNTTNNNNLNKKVTTSTTTMKISAQPTTTAASADTSDVWTDEQDKQLQAGLSQFPATMDKNERWTSIAKGVTGKTKKQCVQRFKAIRDAIKSKK